MNDKRFRYLNLIAERVTALQSDGYMIRVRSVNSVAFFYNLVHHRNGNRINISGSFINGTMTQSRNGKKVYDGEII